MFCLKCQRLASFSPSLPEEVRHHISYADLKLAATKGCNVCSIFQTALLRETAHTFSCSILEAEACHLLLDQTHASKVADTYKVYCKPRGAFRRKKVRSRQRVAGREAFFVCPDTYDTYLRLTSPNSGLRGVLYLRKPYGRDSIPFFEIYPYLGLSSILGTNTVTKLPIIGRTLSVAPDISLASSWIDDCKTNHPLCLAPPAAQLPTRVIDLQPQNASQHVCVVHGKGLRAQYAALSHCWGGFQPLKLTSSTLQQFQICISFSTLPKTFRDAVSVTRSLGLRYLWVDSLCIVQDSKSDWEHECAKMAEVYKNATVTLAGPAATNCDSGFLHARNDQQHLSLELSLNGTSAQVVLSYYGNDQYMHHFGPEPDSTWATRAWILQERLLSRRVLYFGSSHMYFECFTSVRVETCHFPIIWNNQDLSATVKCSLFQFRNKLQLFEYWVSIIYHYSNLQLTVRQDRLPALSGIASDFQERTGSQYLAGLWKDDLPRGLVWIRNPYSRKKVLEHFPDYIAPSWSWASNPNPTSYTISNYAFHFQNDLEILGHQVIPAGKNLHGEVKSGFLQVRGRVRRFLIEYAPVPVAPWRSLHIKNAKGEWIALYAPDYSFDMDRIPLPVTLLYVGKFQRNGGTAMVIEAEQGFHGTYKRIGLAYTDDCTEQSGLEESFHDAERIVLRII